MCTIHESYKNIYFIEFLSPLPLKNIFSFFLFLFLSLSLFGFSSSSSFLLIFFSLLHLLSASPIYSGSSSSPPILPSHAADPSRLVLHLTAHPTPTSLVLHLTTDPSSIANLSFIVDPNSTDTAFIELKSAADFVVVAGFHGFREKKGF